MPGKKQTATGAIGGFMGLIGLSAVAGLLVTAAVTPAIAVAGTAASEGLELFEQIPSYLEIDKLMLPTTIVAQDPQDPEKEVTLATFYDQDRTPVKYDQVAPVVFDAVLSSEDPRFYQHGGVDLIGTGRAVINNLTNTTTQGASSISQQYVKNVTMQLCEFEAQDEKDVIACAKQAQDNSGTTGMKRKVQEMRYAMQIEKEYPKDEILMGYLNIAHFGGVVYGIESASRYYYGIPANRLDLNQASVLAGMVNAPNVYHDEFLDTANTDLDDRFKNTKVRQAYVLNRMLLDGKITQAEHDEALAAPVEPKITPLRAGCSAATGAEYFCQYVRASIESDPAFGEDAKERLANLRRGGMKICTTRNLDLQKTANDTMHEFVPAEMENIALGATAVQVQPGTGKILSMAQNTEFSEVGGSPGQTSIVLAGNAARGGMNGTNAGSTFKIFTLLAWLESGHSLQEPVNGRQRSLSIPFGCGSTGRIPVPYELTQNFEKQAGHVGTPMQFTASSLNSGFYGMAEKLEACKIDDVIKRMHLQTAQGQDIHIEYPFDILGSQAVSPLDMASVYAAVANKGVYCEPRAIEKVIGADGEEIEFTHAECEKAVEPEIAAAAIRALEGAMTGNGSGVWSNARDGVPVFGKTGTHEEEQTWIIQSSTKVTTAVWVGQMEKIAGVDERQQDLFKRFNMGIQVAQLRHQISPIMQRHANEIYGGDKFPEPPRELVQPKIINLPSVVGRSVEEATKILEDAGFSVVVGKPVDSTVEKGKIAEQTPGAGRASSGTLVTISPSTGETKNIEATVPNVDGRRQTQALEMLRAAGFTNVRVTCVEAEGAPEDDGIVISTSPGAGAKAKQGATITVKTERKKCEV